MNKIRKITEKYIGKGGSFGVLVAWIGSFFHALGSSLSSLGYYTEGDFWSFFIFDFVLGGFLASFFGYTGGTILELIINKKVKNQNQAIAIGLLGGVLSGLGLSISFIFLSAGKGAINVYLIRSLSFLMISSVMSIWVSIKLYKSIDK